MFYEKQISDTDSQYCLKKTSSNQSSIFLGYSTQNQFEQLFGDGFSSATTVELSINKKNLILNVIAHFFDQTAWYDRKTGDVLDLDKQWVEDRVDELQSFFGANDEIVVSGAGLNKEEGGNKRLYMKGLHKLVLGEKDLDLRMYLFSSDILQISDLRPGLVKFRVSLPDGVLSDFVKQNLIFRTEKKMNDNVEISDIRQLITYGAPGTGKSYGTEGEIKNSGVDEEKDVFRTTFHPDSDYSTFVGAYKPTKGNEPGCTEIYKRTAQGDILDSVRKELGAITYEFVPQAFIRAYVAAWKKFVAKQGVELEAKDRVYLVIEEINRGHCAQIFGDLFQLLDRNEQGFSDYPIEADSDLAKWLHKQFDKDDFGDAYKNIKGVEDEEGKLNLKLCLPPNLYIRATMNTSDQSLFPMDSAFKRRWEWKYVPISKHEEEGFNDRKIVCTWKEGEQETTKKFAWWDFLENINAQILSTTKSEDKQLGYFFVKVPNEPGEIPAAKFAGKVLFYIYNDVFKDYNYPDAIFAKKVAPGEKAAKYAFKDFFDGKGNVKDAVVAEFLEHLELKADKPEGEQAA